jgi:hypothetical protein
MAWGDVLYQGTASAVPNQAPALQGFSLCGFTMLRGFSWREGMAIKQGLKPIPPGNRYGTTEVVP